MDEKVLEIKIQKLEDELYGLTTCDRHSLVVVPGGSRDGLDYGPALIEIVVLDHDGATIAYRYSDDSLDDSWGIGTPADAVKAWADAVEALEAAEALEY